MFIYQNHQFKQHVFKGVLVLVIGFGFTDFVFAKVVKTPSKSQQNQVVSTTPRGDLYEKISQTTGISLRQLFNLVFQRGNAKQNKSTLAKLSSWANKNDRSDSIYQKRIQAIQTFCDQNANRIPGCHLQIEDIRKEKAEFEAFKNKAKTDKKLALNYYLIVFNQSLRSGVFADLEKVCPEAKVNTEPCMAKRRSIHHIYDITGKLEQVTSVRTRAKSIRKVASHISGLITVYE